MRLAHRGRDPTILHCSGGGLEDDSTYCGIVFVYNMSFYVATFLKMAGSAISILLLQILFCLLHSTALGLI